MPASRHSPLMRAGALLARHLLAGLTHLGSALGPLSPVPPDDPAAPQPGSRSR
ncbi:hypothetical protein [Sphaerisporangium sp. TRM90804]|uniref:hypothetical protein n=1 Tax=Sphaerisporangium sp. TRM90804 TaxID=3031113 RepID=UPI00244C5CA6|nr:hypothetical protein [Sphaerisporangium sp. TRM90804]MDH2427218.1 hypothetical protein [Sphaerisporangium sp. TRM90804]